MYTGKMHDGIMCNTIFKFSFFSSVVTVTKAVAPEPYPFLTLLFYCSTLHHARTAACQASLSFTISWNLLKLMPIESVMPSNYLILCHPLLLLPSIFPSIRVFSNELALCIWWPKYWSFNFNISSSKEYSTVNFL